MIQTLAQKDIRIQSKKMTVWIGLASITMMFVALTSAYLVRRGAGDWLEFELPNWFFISTIVILISSFTLEKSYKAFVNNNESQYKGFLIGTLILGLLFVLTQYYGWQKLHDYGVVLTGNPSGSFIYAISGLHVAHVVGGLTALCVAIFHAISLKYTVTEIRKVRFTMVIHYWHFIGVLWIYLLIFFVLFR
jgi:cytochrome c oxidase subunit 3